MGVVHVGTADGLSLRMKCKDGTVLRITPRMIEGFEIWDR